VEKSCISLSGKMREDLLYNLFSTLRDMNKIVHLYIKGLISKREYDKGVVMLHKMFQDLLDELRLSIECEYIEILERYKNEG